GNSVNHTTSMGSTWQRDGIRVVSVSELFLGYKSGVFHSFGRRKLVLSDADRAIVECAIRGLAEVNTMLSAFGLSPSKSNGDNLCQQLIRENSLFKILQWDLFCGVEYVLCNLAGRHSPVDWRRALHGKACLYISLERGCPLGWVDGTYSTAKKQHGWTLFDYL